jgi:DNA polymerase bacteriophage-type
MDIRRTPVEGAVRILHRDYETRSRADLKKVGTHNYAVDPSTNILCCDYAVDDGPVQLWLPGDPAPPEFIEAAANPEWLVVAHNDEFERLIEQHIMRPRYGWPAIPLERHRCTMAMALAAALPGKLEQVADALQLEHRKDVAGNRLMLKLCKPQPDGSWNEDPELLRQLYDYCRQDVEVERELFHRLPPLPETEQRLWILDAQINERGFRIDHALAAAGRNIAAEAKRAINAELTEITSGAVTTTDQIAKLQAWLSEQGFLMQELNKGAIAALLETEIPAPVRRALELRREAAPTAVTKFKSPEWFASADGRIRGSFRYHGASTGRWSSHGFQVQNMKRPETEDLGPAITAVMTGDLVHLRACYERPLSVVGDLTRALICAAPGKALILRALGRRDRDVQGRVAPGASEHRAILVRARRGGAYCRAATGSDHDRGPRAVSTD